MGAGIEIPVGVKTGAFRQGLASMKHEMEAFKTAATRNNPLQNLGAKLGGLIAIGSIIDGFKRLVGYGSEIQHLADRFRVTAEDIQRVSYAADLAGADVRTVAKALSFLTVEANKAFHGDADLAQSFETLGISAAKFRDMSPEDKLVTLARAYQQASGDGAKLAAIIELLGKKGQALLPMLAEGPEELKKKLEEANVVSNQTVAQLERIGEAFKKMRNLGVWAVDGIVRSMQTVGAAIGSLRFNQFGMLNGFDTEYFKQKYGEAWHPEPAQAKKGNIAADLEDGLELPEKQKERRLRGIDKMRDLRNKRETILSTLADLDRREADARERASKTTDGTELKQFGDAIGKISLKRNQLHGDQADLEDEMKDLVRDASKRDGGKLFASHLASVGGGGFAGLSGVNKTETLLSDIRNYLKGIYDQGREDAPAPAAPTPAFTGHLQSGRGLSTGSLQTGKLGARRR